MRKMDFVETTKLSLNAEFNFRCHKGIKCFTKCCSNIEILLTPYDVIRLKNRLGLSSGEFLSRYTTMKIDEKTTHPFAMLRMNEDEGKTCLFVTPEGCTVYSDRPANCRYYPIGQGTLKVEGKDGKPKDDEFYFFIREPHCYGYHEKKGWTVASWREDQGVDLYDTMNREWKALQLRKNLPGHPELDPKKQMQFYMASYDTDAFRKFIFESKFLDVFDIDKETVEKIRNDEIELMHFGVKYIKYVMMLEETLKVKEEVLKAREKK
ncbi:MAG: YkgJ family cysteine cluster protein [Nitrospiraceae bacterium]|nr:MAG: YkgJ family cysteine cluster protein [Nitrospiraceae bacterium]